MTINYDTAPSGGIDEKVSDLSDTYRNNPEGLQSKYRMSGDLVDLIALQRINKERKAKQQEIAMQMEQKPQNVAQQEYEQAKGLIKDDIVGQTSKLLQEKQKRAVTNQQRMVGGKPPTGIPAAAQRRPANPQMMAGITGVPPRAPVNPRGTGIAANRVPSSPTAYGAGGGIVSFADGDEVRLSAEEILKSINHTPESFRNLSEAKQAELIKYLNTQRAAQRPDMFTRAGAAAGDLFFGALGAPLNILGDVARHQGVVHPETKFLGEYDPGLLSKAAQARADDPNLQPLRPADLRAHDLGAITPQVQTPPPIPQIPSTPVLGETDSEFDSPAPSLEDQLLGLTRADARPTEESRIDEYRELLGEAVVPERGAMSVPTARDIDPTGYDKGTAERADDQTQLKEISDQDPKVARGESAEWAGEVMDRSGIQTRYDDMIQAQQDLQTGIEADRAKYGMYDAFGDMGNYGLASLGESYTRQRGRYREEDKSLLGTQQELMKAAISSDTDIGKVMVEAGMASEDSVRDSIVSALDNRNNIVTDERRESSEQANRVLEAQMEDIRAQDRRIASIQSQIATQVSVEAKLALGAMQHQLMQEENNIKALGYLMKDRATGEALLVEAEKNVAMIRSDIMTMGLAAAEGNEFGIWAKLTPEEQLEEKNKLLEDYKLLADRNEKKFRQAIATTRSRIQNDLTVTQQSP